MKYRDTLLEAEKLKNDGQYREAVSICEKILVKDPKNLIALEEIGDNYLSMGKIENSKKALKRALEIEPKSVNANYLLGFIFSIEHKWDLSIKYLKKSEEIERNNPEILRCLGWSLFNYGRQKEGIILLERVKNITPKDAFVLCDLGVCYMLREKYAKALDLFINAEKLDPENRKVKDCIKIARIFRSKV